MTADSSSQENTLAETAHRLDAINVFQNSAYAGAAEGLHMLPTLESSDAAVDEL